MSKIYLMEAYNEHNESLGRVLFRLLKNNLLIEGVEKDKQLRSVALQILKENSSGGKRFEKEP